MVECSHLFSVLVLLLREPSLLLCGSYFLDCVFVAMIIFVKWRIYVDRIIFLRWRMGYFLITWIVFLCRSFGVFVDCVRRFFWYESYYSCGSFFLAIVFCRCTWGMTIYFCILVIILLCGLKLYSDGSDFRAGVFFSPESFNNATFPSH